MVSLQGYILVPMDEIEQIKAALVEHSRLTRAEAGCMTFTVEQNSNLANRFEVYEEFVDMTAFELHQARVKSSAWGELSKNVERHYHINQSK